MAHRKKSKPNSVKGGRRSNRTSGILRARDWQKTYREYLTKKQSLSSIEEYHLDTVRTLGQNQ